MSNTGAVIKPEAIREIAFGSLTTSYQDLGSPFGRVVRFITLDNGTDTDIYLTLSTSAIDQFRVRPGQAKVFDLKTNDALINVGDIIRIRSKTAPSMGDAFMECITC